MAPLRRSAGCRRSQQPPHEEKRRRRTVFDLLRDAEIRNLDVALVVNKDVGALDIAMYNLALVKVVKTREDLPDELGDEGLFEGAVVLEERRDGTAGDVLEENVEVLAVAG